VWLAKLTEKGLLQASFVPPYDIRRLRELTRLRADLVHDKSRYWARLEKLLERALIKISAVLSTLDTDTARGDDRGADRRPARPGDAGGAGHRQGPRQAR
jgi:transposase